MENNENNIQNQEKMKAKGMPTPLVIILLIVVLIIGVGGGYLLSINLNQAKTTNNTENNNVIQNKTSKKIDESKPWVYDADYGDGKENKKISPEYSNDIYSTKDKLKVPYININSEYANKLNSEIKKIYDKAYNEFGSATITNGETEINVREIKYETYNKNDILSIILTIYSGVLNGGFNPEYKIYNIDLNTLNNASLFDIGKTTGFQNQDELNIAINTSLLNAKKSLIASENAVINNDLYYIDNNGILNMMVLSISEMSLTNINIVNSTTQTTSNNNSNTEISNYTIAIAEIQKCLKDENWLKENIFIKESEMIGEDANTSDQEISFIVCKSNSKPIIVIETSSINARFIKLDLVTYENNKVTVKRINQGHIYHGGYGIDANKCIVCTSFMHMGENAIMLHSIFDGKISSIGSYKYEENINNEIKYFIKSETENNSYKEVSKDEYTKYKKELNEDQYNFVAINTPLTNQNVDSYIK